MKGKATKTRSGKEVQLYANIGNVSDLALVLANDAGGIGLFRSEFLFLNQDHLPTEEEQFYAYRQVAETMAGKKVIIRTLDLALIYRWIISSWIPKKTRQWDCVRFEYV